jgi:hypothetical protein
MIHPVELPAVDIAAIEDAIGPLEGYARRCGGASVRLVESGLYPGARVARGWVRGILGQHSWVCLGDPYRPKTPVVDLTLWSYKQPDAAPQWVRSADQAVAAWVGRVEDKPHHPHGWGVLWPQDWPEPGDGPPVPLTPRTPLSGYAQMFLEHLGPLDRRGWSRLVNGPVGGWPASEIIDAVCDTQELVALVPIDIEGMLTDRNPGGAYPRTPERTS